MPHQGAPSRDGQNETAVLVNLLNPKLSIFFFAFLPRFVSADEPHAVARMLELGAMLMLGAFVALGGKLALAER
jgi:threonine/homoserine/homoserine lactone efflux protein